MALYKGGVARGRGVHHRHRVGRDAVAVGWHRGRVDQDRGGGGHVAAGEAGVQGEVPGARRLVLTGLKHRGLRLVRGRS